MLYVICFNREDIPEKSFKTFNLQKQIAGLLSVN